MKERSAIINIFSMNEINYQKTIQGLIKNLSEREKEVISRRFGFNGKERETLEAIGKGYGVCRERIRQIQEGAIKKIKEVLPQYKTVFNFFDKHLQRYGGLRKEKTLLSELGDREQNEVFFLLFLWPKFYRFPENKEFFAFWTNNKEAPKFLSNSIKSVILQLKKAQKPLSIDQINFSSPKENLESILEISKKIDKNKNSLYGLTEWPEIAPKGIKDKAYIVLKELRKPLHFTEIAKFIEKSNVHTVHNELIKDKRFVLIGRGTYALSEWGYEPGQVKEVIAKILSQEKKPLTKEEIIERVLKQRLVKENTVLMNLSNRKYFTRDENGKYRLRTEIA